MPIQELEYAREKDPGFKSVPDAELAQYLAEKDPGFADLPQRVQQEQRGPVMGAVDKVLQAPYRTESGEAKAPNEIEGAWHRAKDVLIPDSIKQLIEFETTGGTDTSHPISDIVKGAMTPFNPINAAASGLGRLGGEIDYHFEHDPKKAGAIEGLVALASPYGVSKALSAGNRLAGSFIQRTEKSAEAIKAIPTEAELTGAKAQPGMTGHQFGKQFKEIIYPESKAEAQKEASRLYKETIEMASDKDVAAEKIGKQIGDTISKSGIAVKIMPTKAERIGMKITGAIDPVTEEENIYKEVRAMMTPEQVAAFQAGGQNLPRQVLNKLFEGLPSFGGAAAAERVSGLSEELALPEKIGLDEIIALRQRLNGAIRASRRSPFDAHQLVDMRSAINKTIEESHPEVWARLKGADANYAKNYIPYYGFGSPLHKISQKGALEIVDKVVDSKRVETVEQFMTAFDGNAKQAIRSGWIQNLITDSKTADGSYDVDKIAKAYRSTPKEVRSALLGQSEGNMDKLVERMTEGVKAVQASPSTARHFAAYGGSTQPIIYSILASKDLLEAGAGVGGKRYYIFAAADLLRAALFTNPEMFVRWAMGSGKAIDYIDRIATMDSKSPAFTTAVLGLERGLRETSDILKEEEKQDASR